MTPIVKDSALVDTVIDRFIADYPKLAAVKLEHIDRACAVDILARLPVEKLVAVWEAMGQDAAGDILRQLPDENATILAQHSDTGKLAVVLSRMPDDDRDAILARLDGPAATELRDVMTYPPDTAGHLMDTRILPFRGETTAREAIEILRQRRAVQDVSELKVVDDENKLKAVVDIKDLALAEPEQTLDSLSEGVTAFVMPMDPREEVVEKLEQYNLDELPVISPDGHLLGTIRHAGLLDALKANATLDMQTMVGASREERATSSSWLAIRKRMPWLQVNLLTAFMAAAVVGLFEDTIAKFTALAVLLPVVAGQSGNAGAQALAVTMRGLALREVRLSQWRQVLTKEMNTGLWNGVSIAVTCGIAVFIWSGQIGLVIVIASSMIIAMVMAGMAGALVPITLRRLGQDPAVASSIILTTVTDIAGFFSFLGIATLLSSMLS
ncbi:MAG: magnesium transporter [Rhodospirillales bacterium]|nr:magnesium transporter [Rhodospirillales bacterium]